MTELKGEKVPETRASLTVVSTRVKCLLIYSMIEKVTLLSLPQTQVANCNSYGPIHKSTPTSANVAVADIVVNFHLPFRGVSCNSPLITLFSSLTLMSGECVPFSWPLSDRCPCVSGDRSATPHPLLPWTVCPPVM